MGRDEGGAIRIVVLHASRLLRESLAHVLTRQDNLIVVGLGATPEDLGDLVDRPPDVVLVDLAPPSRLGLDHARELTGRWPSAAVLMLGVKELESDLMDCCEAGATACLFDEASLNDVLAQIRASAAGEALCAPRVAGFLFSQLRDSARQLRRLRALDVPHLTRRELEILSLIEERLTNKEIAVRLNIEIQTVKNHVHNILQNLELESRRDAVRFAREHGLLPARTASMLFADAPAGDARLGAKKLAAGDLRRRARAS